MKILVSTISYVNTYPGKEKSTIYTTFADRLATDVKTKTPFDIRINTNQKELFEEDDRVSVRDDFFKDHHTHVGAFNQLLKFSAIQQVDKKYEWVLYLDCDAGFKDNIDTEKVFNYINNLNKLGIEMVAVRTNCTFEGALEEFNTSTKNGTDFTYTDDYKRLFNDKFRFYGIRDEWKGAKFPSEHFFLIKNTDKLQNMADHLEALCYEFETQDKSCPATIDMEAYEIGVAARSASIDMQEVCGEFYNYHLKIGFNFNNFEKVKI